MVDMERLVDGHNVTARQEEQNLVFHYKKSDN